jgi:hypothetical protein
MRIPAAIGRHVFRKPPFITIRNHFPPLDATCLRKKALILHRF